MVSINLWTIWNFVVKQRGKIIENLLEKWFLKNAWNKQGKTLRIQFKEVNFMNWNHLRGFSKHACKLDNICKYLYSVTRNRYHCYLMITTEENCLGFFGFLGVVCGCKENRLRIIEMDEVLEWAKKHRRQETVRKLF